MKLWDEQKLLLFCWGDQTFLLKKESITAIEEGTTVTGPLVHAWGDYFLRSGSSKGKTAAASRANDFQGRGKEGLRDLQATSLSK